MIRAVRKLQENHASDPNQPVEKHGPVIQGFFGIGGITALIKGVTYMNDGDVNCPWSPTLPDYLLAYGIFNVSLPLFYLVVLCVLCFAAWRKSTKVLSAFTFVIYLPVLSAIVNGGLVIWGFVLLYSNPDPVTYEPYDPNVIVPVLNENYCAESIYFYSMFVSWWYVAILILVILFYGIRYLRSRRS